MDIDTNELYDKLLKLLNKYKTSLKELGFDLNRPEQISLENLYKVVNVISLQYGVNYQINLYVKMNLYRYTKSVIFRNIMRFFRFFVHSNYSLKISMEKEDNEISTLVKNTIINDPIARWDYEYHDSTDEKWIPLRKPQHMSFEKAKDFLSLFGYKLKLNIIRRPKND